MLGGALVDSIGWRAVFLVNIPVGIIAIVLTALYVPESRAEHPRRVDPVGQVLVIVGAGHAHLRDHRGPRGRLAVAAQTLVLFAVSVLALRHARRLRAAPPRAADRDPLLPQRHRSPERRAIAVAMFAALGGFLFLNTLYLQDVRGLSPFSTPACTRCRWPG